MRSLVNVVAGMPEILPQVADLLWGTPAERMRAVDAIVATADRGVLPVLCERIGDASTEVVAHILARIDLLDPIAAVLVAREMILDGREDHLRVAISYFQRHAPWELPEGAPRPVLVVESIGETTDLPRLHRGLIARHPAIRRAAAKQLMVVGNPDAILDLEVHLQGAARIPFDGILTLFVRVQPMFAFIHADTASQSRGEASDAVLVAMARVGGRGTQILLSLLHRKRCEVIEAALLRYRPRELLEHCRKWLRDGDPDRSVQAISILGEFVAEPAVTSPALQRAALGTLVAALERPQPPIKAQVLRALSRTSAAATVPCDPVRLLRHRDPQVRCGALELLSAQRRMEQLGAIERALGDGDAGVRACALQVLAQLDPERQIERVREAMGDEDPRVMDAALESLDGRAIPSGLCDEGCRVLRESPGGGRDILLEWLLGKFPQRSTTILMSALQSKVQAVQNQAAGVLFGCGAGGV